MQIAGQGDRDLSKNGHVPGEKCTDWVAHERRDSNGYVPGRQGIWAGFSDEVPGGHCVIPVSWPPAG